MFKKIKNILVLSLFPVFNLFAANGSEIITPNKVKSIEDFMSTVLNSLLKISVPIIVLAIMYVGFLFVKAQGDPNEIKEAKSSLIYVLLGTAIVIIANILYSILSVAHSTTIN